MKPDLAKFAAAVRFRDRAAAAAVEHHQRAGLVPSWTYARATFDAIEQMIREDEREKLAAAGRLLPPDTPTAVEYGTQRADGMVYDAPSRDLALADEAHAKGRGWSLVAVQRTVWAGPWRPVPSTPEETPR